MRAVVVDDHAGFRRQACLVLEEAGFDVVGEAGNAREAVAIIRRLEPDVVLLDVHLPDADGFSVVADLSELAPRPAVVLISGRDQADYGEASRIEGSGALGFIAKADLTPIAFREIVSDTRPGRPG